MSITKISPSVVDFDAGITISTTDNSDNLTLTSTDADANTGPVLNLNRAVTGADDDLLGSITFAGQDDANNAVDYAFIQAHLKDASDGAEDGLIDFQVMHAGTSRSALILNGGGTVIVNQDSQDMDFRVESNDNANMLVVDAGTNAVGVGVSPSGATFHVVSSGSGVKARFSDNTSETLDIGITENSHAYFNQANSGPIAFQIGGTEEMRVTSNGLTFNGDTAAANALDDYEEGTFTPTYTGSSATGSQGYSYQNGFYIKVGSLVTCFVDMNITSSSGMSGTSLINLPFPSVNANWYAPFVPWEVSTAFTDSDQKAIGFVVTNSSTMSMYKYVSLNSNVESSGYFNQNVTGRISGQFTYQAA